MFSEIPSDLTYETCMLHLPVAYRTNRKVLGITKYQEPSPETMLRELLEANTTNDILLLVVYCSITLGINSRYNRHVNRKALTRSLVLKSINQEDNKMEQQQQQPAPTPVFNAALYGDAFNIRYTAASAADKASMETAVGSIMADEKLFTQVVNKIEKADKPKSGFIGWLCRLGKISGIVCLMALLLGLIKFLWNLVFD